MRRWKQTAYALPIALTIASAAIFAACMGPDGPPGPSGPPGDGGSGAQGIPGPTGPAGPLADASTRTHVTTGPGLALAVSSAAIDSNGVVTATFSITDGTGVPLDLAGVFTDGAVSAKLVLARLGTITTDAGVAPGEYSAYTTQPHALADGGAPESMADSDTGGQFTELGSGAGTYAYTFGTKMPAGFDATKTHTVGVWAYRDFGGQRYVVNTLFDFVPSGSPVTVTRDIVKTQACNQCHNPLGVHEDDMQRRDAKLCILCHSTPMTDVTTGEALDMPTMIHKIHRGRSLPSVVKGAPYQLTADDGSLDDHSDTWFPDKLQTCPKCHQGSQGDVWKTTVKRSLCTTCHDRTWFADRNPPAGWTMHGGDKQTDDSACGNCHTPKGTPLSVADAHYTASTDPSAPVIALTIASVEGTAPGATPIVHFTVTKSGQPLDLVASPLTGLAATIAGPTTDYASATTYQIQGTNVTGSLALDGAAGHYAYTFPSPIPPSATGSYAIGMEGYLQDATTPTTIYAAENPVTYVTVTDQAATPRRTVVERDKCNSCHGDLAAHGGRRKSPEYCVLCHGPNAVDAVGAPRLEVPQTIAPSINFKVMVHKIHRGDALAQGYVLGGYPLPTAANPSGTQVDFGTVTFPGNQRACWACHASTSYMLPLPQTLLPTKSAQTLACSDPSLDPASYCTTQTVQSESFVAPIGAACTGCHDQPSTMAHANVMTASDGTESCATCHGLGKPWDVQVVHVLPP